MKKKKKSYLLAILINVVALLIPGIAFVNAVFSLMAGYMSFEISLLIFSLTLALYLIARRYLKGLLTQAVLDNEYDEFGISNKKKFENLTRAKREEIDLQKAADMERLLSSSVLKQIVHKGSDNPEKDLGELIGLKNVKERTNEMLARMKFEKERRKRGVQAEGHHMCFYGSPGTGKTTVARIMTGILYEYGYIKKNKCVEIDGNFLKAGPDSATKTRLVIRQAYDGVLFIDEAYSIVDGTGEYGKEVVATLIKEMEDNRDRFVLILAGYKNDMERLLSSNEGFKSRIKEYLNFADYDEHDMRQIFAKMANSEGFAVSGDGFDNFDIRIAKERRLSTFGNGRTARQVLDESIDRHAVLYMQGKKNKDNKYMLDAYDINTEVNKDKL